MAQWLVEASGSAWLQPEGLGGRREQRGGPAGGRGGFSAEKCDWDAEAAAQCLFHLLCFKLIMILELFTFAGA